MGMAETYDVLFTVPEHKNFELRATVQDVTGYASAWIGMGEKVPAPSKPLPDMYALMDHASHGSGHSGHEGHGGGGGGHEGHGNHDGHAQQATTDSDPHAGHGEKTETKATGHEGHGSHMNHGEHQHMNMDHSMHGAHAGHMNKSKPAKTAPQEKAKPLGPIDWSTQSDAMLRQNGAPRNLQAKGPVIETLTVDALKSIEPTTFPKDAKVHDVKLVLDGDMERYIWHINGKAIYEDRLLMINRGEVVRFTLVNETMMHHPMHFHGHFFRVINENGEYSPLKHTVDFHLTRQERLSSSRTNPDSGCFTATTSTT